MNASIDEQVREYRREGPRRFAGWNQSAFDSYVKGPVATLERSLKWHDKKKPDPDSVSNFLRLVFEGVGAGWLRTIQGELPPPTFLAHALTSIVPNKLGGVSQGKRTETLQMVWNLGEGLAREPRWLDQYVVTQTGWYTDLGDLDQHIEKLLEPVLSPPPAARWDGRYHLHLMNLRESNDAFVPGHLYLASPAVMCVENRLSPSETLAILLGASGKSRVLGAVGRLPEHRESFDAPSVTTTPDAITINDSVIEAPHIASPRETLCVASGFVVVTAEDSQRLWIVEAK